MVANALKNPYAVIVAALAVAIVGLTVMLRMGVDILPTFKTPAVQILTFYPGMPAEIVEQDISTRLERWTGQANGVARQESKSMVGVSIVKDYFRPDIDPNTAMSMTSSLAMSDLYYLPPGTVPPMVMPFDPTATIPLAVITVSSPTADETRLYDIAYFDLRNKLQAISGVIAPAVYGGKLRRILAYVDPEKLHARALSPMDVITAIRSQNVLIPTGSAKFGDIEYQINANAMVDRVAEINDLPIKMGADGRPVFVRDVADAKDTSQIQTNIVRIDGRRQVYIPIYRQPGANTIAIVDAIRDQLKPIQERLPPDIKLDVVMDQSVYVRNSIGHLQLEAIIGAGLAALMILLFIGSVRSTLIVLMTLPLAVIAALLGLFLTDQTLNTMTLGGLALAVGLLIDQAIVVIENIERHLAMGKSPLRASLDGGQEMAKPLLVITVTIIAVFFPVLFLVGMGKLLFSALALAVVCAIVGSYIIAVTLVPAACAKILRRHAHEDSNRKFVLFRWSDKGYHALQRGYVRWLDGALQRRPLVLLAALALFAGSLMLAPRLGQEFFPQVDSGQIMVRVRAPSGLRVERTEEIVKEAEAIVSEVIPETERLKVISNIGVLLDWPAAYTPNSGPMDAFLSIQLAQKTSKSSMEYAGMLRRELNDRLPGNEFAVDYGGMITAALTFGLPSPINIQIEGKDLEIGGELAQSVRERVARIPGAVDVRVQQRRDYPMIQIEIDRTKAAMLGLTQEQVVKNVVTALNSSINFAPSFWIDHSNGNHYFLGAQFRESDIESLETLRNLPITGTGTTQPVLLRNIAKFHRSTAPTEVNHVNIARVIDVYANVAGRDVGAVADDAERALAGIDVPPGFRVLMRGEVATMKESFGNMGFGLALAVVLVYLVLVVQFRSFLDPLIVLGEAPLGAAGVIGTLLATGTTVNIQSIMGLIMMVGITVSFSVLYLDHANRRLEEGLTVHDAIRDAARVRLRPILMTSIAAILGMLPMALTPAQANTPLAIAVIGGLLASTVLKLFVVPVLYTYLKRPVRRNAEAEELFGRPGGQLAPAE